MKLYGQNILLLIATFCFFNSSLKAQPFNEGCHFIHNQIPYKAPTAEQVKRKKAEIARSDSFNVINYDIDLNVTDFTRSRISGVCNILFESKLENLNQVVFDLLDLDVLSVKDGAGNELTYIHSGFYVVIDWSSTFVVGEENSVVIEYEGRPTVSGAGFGGFYFENGYAYNLGIDLQGEPHNFGRSWFPCFDNFVERATYDIHLTSTNGRKGYAIGEFIGEEQLGPDSIRRSYTMDQLLPTYLVGVAVSNYTEVNGIHNGAYGDIPTQLIARSIDTNEVKQSMAFLADAIDGLEYWFGPYQWDRVGYVITSRGAMEHSTCIAYPESSINGGTLSTRLMAHELAHHWWGNYVTVNYAPDMWIKEGNAEYGAHLVLGYIAPDDFPSVVRNNHYTVMTTAHVNDGEHLALSPMSQENTYGTHTYNKGASMMHNLHGYLGDSLFRSGMQDLLVANSYSFLNAQDFRDGLSSITGVDLTSFFDDWIFGKGWSDFYLNDFTYDQSSNVCEVTVGQGEYFSDHMHTNAAIQLTLYNAQGEMADIVQHFSGAMSTVQFESPISNPISIAVNRNNHLNLGMFEKYDVIDAPGNYRDSKTLHRASISASNAPAHFSVEHHLTMPQGDYNDALYQISENHFWHVAGNFESKITGTMTLPYDSKGTFNFDADLVSNSEDSIIVLYRPDGISTWTEYDYYRKIKILNNDGKGNMILDSLMCGDYVFANLLDFTVATKNTEKNDDNLTIYPNPSSDYIQIKLEDEVMINIDRIEIYNLTGELMRKENIKNQMINEYKIDVSAMKSGVYFAYILDENGKNQVAKFEVIK